MKKPIATIVWENALFPEQPDLERLLVRYAKVAELQDKEIEVVATRLPELKIKNHPQS